jgi:hypothetical protein
MNERIKELALQAGAKVDKGIHPITNIVDGLSMGPDEVEKFAELIVRECANVVLEPHNESNFIISMSKCKFSTRQAIDRAAQTGGLKCDTESVSNQILKHFGVE